jgi:hypothetical protein
MPPAPLIPTVLEPGQTTLSFNRLQIIPKRPGKPPLLVHKVPARRNQRWLFGSQYETLLVRQFRAARLMALGSAESDPNEVVQHRHSYSRELKLSAIEWATNTYVKGKKDGDPDELITRYAAAARLGITSTMLRDWIRTRVHIAKQ